MVQEENVTCVGANVYRLGAHTAIDLDVFLGEAGTKLGDFGNATVEELLATATFCDLLR